MKNIRLVVYSKLCVERDQPCTQAVIILLEQPVFVLQRRNAIGEDGQCVVVDGANVRATTLLVGRVSEHVRRAETVLTLTFDDRQCVHAFRIVDRKVDFLEDFRIFGMMTV